MQLQAEISRTLGEFPDGNISAPQGIDALGGEAPLLEIQSADRAALSWHNAVGLQIAPSVAVNDSQKSERGRPNHQLRIWPEKVAMTAQKRKAGGFSLIELMFSIIVMGIMTAAAVLQLQPVMQQWRANAAMDQVLGQLLWARQVSIAQRRDILVQFLGKNEIKLTRQDVPAGTTVLSDLFLSGNAQFMLVAGMPDTPDAFGNASPIEFGGVAGGPPIMQFQSDGMLVDGNGNPIDGTVFFALPNFPSTARAVTVLGATGRVRAFRGTGKDWIQ